MCFSYYSVCWYGNSGLGSSYKGYLFVSFYQLVSRIYVICVVQCNNVVQLTGGIDEFGAKFKIFPLNNFQWCS